LLRGEKQRLQDVQGRFLLTSVSLGDPIQISYTLSLSKI
jgi:hypothetical protein